MVGWHHWHNGHEFEQTRGDSEGQGAWYAAVHDVCQVTSILSDSLQPYGLQPSRLLCPWGSLEKNTLVGFPCPPGDLPNPGIKPVSLMPPALAGRFFTTSASWEVLSGCSPWGCQESDMTYWLNNSCVRQVKKEDGWKVGVSIQL